MSVCIIIIYIPRFYYGFYVVTIIPYTYNGVYPIKKLDTSNIQSLHFGFYPVFFSRDYVNLVVHTSRASVPK